jgi:hypothetical protein
MRSDGASHTVSSDLAKAEALFKGLQKKKTDEAKAEAAPAAADGDASPPAAPEKTRRRVRIRDVSAIRAPAAAPAEKAKAEAAPADRVFRRQLSDTLRQLGRDGTPRAAQSKADTVDHEGALRASVAPAVVNAFQVKIAAPGVDPDGELTFVIEGDDIAQVASDALVRVAEYMAENHPGSAWKMQALERLPLALAPRR